MKITQQEIANALSLSRNTVSKALKNDILVSPETIQRVQEYARKNNYYNAHENSGGKFVSLIMHNSVAKDNFFWPVVIRGIEKTLAELRYGLTISFVDSMDDVAVDNGMAGYLMMGMFSDDDYYKAAKRIQSPLVLIDISSKIPLNELQRDIVMMENAESVRKLTNHMISLGHTKIGFVGNTSARSVYDRYRGYKRAMIDNELKIKKKYCLLNFSHQYDSQTEDSILYWFSRFDKSDLPTAFVCANDSIADNIRQWCNQYFGFDVPGDVSVSGFDNLEEKGFTTVHCFKYEMGQRAAEELVWRIQNPDRPYEIIRVGTKVVLRDTISKPRSI